MDWSVATLHVRTTQHELLMQYVSSLADEELEPFVKTARGWTSVHCQDALFVDDVGTVAPTLSKVLGTVAVVFRLLDRATLTCSTYAKGRRGEELVFTARRRTTFNAAAWKRAGIPDATLERLAQPFDDVTEAAVLIARGLRIPEETVLVDDPALMESLDDPPGKRLHDPEIARAWAALERDATAAGVKVPRFEEFLELQGEPRDPDEVLGMIELLRAEFLS